MTRLLGSHYMSIKETIAAIATPPGRGGIGIVRLSGAQVPSIAQQLLGILPPPRYAKHHTFLDEFNEAIDQGLVVYFPEPHSFTGEHILELQGHGGPAVLDLVLRRVLQLGARLARPGEFSERAFLNKKLDLSQAEAIADLIHATSEQAAKAAMRSLQGAFSKKIETIREALVLLRTHVEASIDFSEEEIDLLSGQRFTSNLQEILHTIASLKDTTKQGQLLQEGYHIVLTGPANAGKSSLMNALSQRDTAIVTNIPGTTRDVLHTSIQLDGLLLHISDTAGLRVTQDPIEQAGIQRALNTIKQADLILWVVDSSITPTDYTPFSELKEFGITIPTTQLTLIRNKIDLSLETEGVCSIDPLRKEYGGQNRGIAPDKKRSVFNIREHRSPSLTTSLGARRPFGEDLMDNGLDIVRLSVETHQGLTTLHHYLKQKAGIEERETEFSARRRHVVALEAVEESLTEGLEHWLTHGALEILAMYLTQAHASLGEITGAFSTEDLLSNIFSNFCIGK